MQQGQEALLGCHGLRWSLTTQYNNWTKHKSSDWAAMEKQLLPLSYQGTGEGCSLLLSRGCSSAPESVWEVGRLWHSQWLITGLHFQAAVFAYWVCLVNLCKNKYKQGQNKANGCSYDEPEICRWAMEEVKAGICLRPPHHPGHCSEELGKCTARVGVVGFTKIILLW